MNRLTLGRSPDVLSVNLSAGTFRATLRSQSQSGVAVDWPDGSSLRMVLHTDSFSASYPFEIDGDQATIVIPASTIASLPRSLKAQLWLNYGEGEFLWCSGEVARHA